MTTTARDVLATARQVADDLLFPDAMRVKALRTAGCSNCAMKLFSLWMFCRPIQ